MDSAKKQFIALETIKILKSRFESFPDESAIARNAPFHKAFLRAFERKLAPTGTSTDALISVSSWLHGLNTTLGQSFFENVAHALSCGEKKTFNNQSIYVAQQSAVSNIMTDLKNAAFAPNVEREEEIVFSLDEGEMTNAPNFTADCFFEDNERVVAIELKSVRPNSGEMRGEKQKILLSKAALRILYPGKKIYYYFGFPFDPLASTDTGYDKAKFMDSVIEMTKFCAPEEVLLSDELWSFLSGAPGTMQEILDVISDIATPDFYDNLEFIMDAHNITQNPDKYRAIISKWHLYDEIEILDNWGTIAASARKDVAKYRNQGAITQDGKFNVSRNKSLHSCIIV